jgi:hypothetical protein
LSGQTDCASSNIDDRTFYCVRQLQLVWLALHPLLPHPQETFPFPLTQLALMPLLGLALSLSVHATYLPALFRHFGAAAIAPVPGATVAKTANPAAATRAILDIVTSWNDLD